MIPKSSEPRSTAVYSRWSAATSEATSAPASMAPDEVVVHGACVGAGVELAAFADRVIARPSTRFRLPEVGMGLIPGAGGAVSIPRRIGRCHA